MGKARRPLIARAIGQSRFVWLDTDTMCHVGLCTAAWRGRETAGGFLSLSHLLDGGRTPIPVL